MAAHRAKTGQLGELFDAAGLSEIGGRTHSRGDSAQLRELVETITLGVGPAGAYVTGLDPKRRDELRETCRSLLSEPPITLSATAWAALGRA